MRYTPKRRTSAHIFLPLSLFAAGLVLFFTSIAGVPGAVFFQAGAFALLVAGIDLTAKFTLNEHSYAISEFDDDPPDAFIVTSGKGKRRINEYIPLASCTELVGPVSAIPKNLRAHRRYTYMNTLLADGYYLLIFDDPSTGDDAIAKLELDEAFAAAIRERIGKPA